MPNHNFNEIVAKDVLKRMRDGKSLTSICEELGIERTDVYDWLREPKAKMGKQGFKAAYAQAEEDRRRTWKDMAANLLSKLTVNAADQNLIKTQIQLLLSLAKEPSIREIKDQIDADVPVVVIQKFMPTQTEEVE